MPDYFVRPVHNVCGMRALSVVIAGCGNRMLLRNHSAWSATGT